MKLISSLLLAVPAIASFSHAAVLAQYTFPTSGSSAASSLPTTEDPSIDATSITAGGSRFVVSNTSTTAFIRGDVSAGSLSDAIAANDYLEFSVSVIGTGTVNLTSFTFGHEGSKITVSGNPPPADYISNMSVFVSLNGFSTTPLAGDVLGTSSGQGNLGTQTFALTAPEYQNLTSADTVTFRIYGYDDGSDTNQVNRVRNVTLNGDAIPEPTAPLLLGCGALGFMLRRRRA